MSTVALGKLWSSHCCILTNVPFLKWIIIIFSYSVRQFFNLQEKWAVPVLGMGRPVPGIHLLECSVESYSMTHVWSWISLQILTDIYPFVILLIMVRAQFRKRKIQNSLYFNQNFQRSIKKMYDATLDYFTLIYLSLPNLLYNNIYLWEPCMAY